MGTEQVALAHHAERNALGDNLGHLARSLWAEVSLVDLDGTWARVAPHLVVGLAGGQLTAARRADRYITRALAAQGADGDPSGEVNANAFAGVASDGRPLDSLLRNPITVVKTGLARGAGLNRSMAAGYANLDMIVRTQLADAGRGADHVAIVARRQATGYVRMVVGKTCSRCTVLAGRRYRVLAGFKRHPR